MVDDSDDDAFLLYTGLSATGPAVDYQRVDSAADLRQALKESDWDVIISDHAMPGFSAVEALDIVKESGKDIPFLIYSGHISEQTAVTTMLQGASDFVEKGNIRRLVPAIEREIANAAIRRAKERADEYIQQLCYYDDLTGLPNRSRFCKEVDARCQPSVGEPVRGVIAFLDLDRFARINSTFGYATGDKLIEQASRRLQANVPLGGFLARLGHDEFALFVADTSDQDEARQVAEKMLAAFTEPFNWNGIDFYITVSVGLSVFPEDGRDVATLLKNAESAMHLAKRSGRNTFQFYQNEFSRASGEHLILESSLRRALERHELFVQYQPCFDLASGQIAGSEALVRWRHPEFGVVQPDKFIALADETGLITEIGAWVMEEACAQTRAWHNLGYEHLNIAVNVSAMQFRSADFLSRVRTVLDRTGLNPRYLELEITESAVMQEVDTTILTLRALKELGVRISIDDFGTGYSSLSYLRRFPLDILKIDKSFVRDIPADADDSAIVRAITTLAKTLKLVVQAEGVETEEQADFLRGLACERVQGYFFARPLGPDAVFQMLKASVATPAATGTG
ncbi:MAG: GGDEF domain-containing response regulator [Betaproteobacteria bacterium]|nr:GGDEF domain-containing response regulator [Betaproteobacteria bacterium]